MQDQWPDSYLSIIKDQRDYFFEEARKASPINTFSIIAAIVGLVQAYRWLFWAITFEHESFGAKIQIPIYPLWLLLTTPFSVKLIHSRHFNNKIALLDSFDKKFPNFKPNYDWRHPTNPNQIFLVIKSSKDHNNAQAHTFNVKKNLLNISKKYSIAYRVIDSADEITTCINQIFAAHQTKYKQPPQIKYLFIWAHSSPRSMSFKKRDLDDNFIQDNPDLFSKLPKNAKIFLQGCNTYEASETNKNHTTSIAYQIAELAAPRPVSASINETSGSATNIILTSKGDLKVHFNQCSAITEFQNDVFGNTFFSSSTRVLQLDRASCLERKKRKNDGSNFKDEESSYQAIGRLAHV